MTTMPPDSAPLPFEQTEALESVSRGAVDILDIAARLEASGVTDRMARQSHGSADVFALAATLRHDATWSERSAGGRPAWGELGEAIRRAVLLVAGVLLASAVLGHLGLAPTSVWLVGSLGWVGGQIVSAIAWTRLGWGQGGSGLRRGGSTALVVLLAAGVAGALVGRNSPAPVTSTVFTLGWVAYAMAVSLLVCARRTQAALAVVLGSLLVMGAALFLHGTWPTAVVLAAAAAAACAVVALAARTVLSAGHPALPDRVDLLSAAPAATQATLLAASLLLLLQTVPGTSATPIVAASVAGAALADPAIAALRSHLRTSAGRIYVVALAARRARQAAVLAAASTAAVSALVAATVVIALRAGAPDWTTAVLPAAAFTAVATTSAALTAFGAPWRAALAAASAVVYAVTALVSIALATVVVFPMALIAAITLLLHRVSDPRVAV